MIKAVQCHDEKVITLLACGDILLADFYFNIGVGISNLVESSSSKTIFSGVKQILSSGDLLVGNLECPISIRSNKKGIHKQEFLAHPKAAFLLKNAGFKVLNIANNHISQHGVKAFCDTIENLSQNDICITGETTSKKEQLLKIIEIKGKKLGFISYSLVSDQFSENPWFYSNQPSKAKMLEEVTSFARKCDQLIVMLHWGDEFVNRPSQEQRSIAYEIIDAGCDILIGSHSHVFQGIEQYKGKSIAYSLGNFVFSMPYKPARASGILKVRICPDGRQLIEIIPIWINDNSLPIVPQNSDKTYVETCIRDANHQLVIPTISEKQYSELVSKGLTDYRKSTRIEFVRKIFSMKFTTSLQLLFEFFRRKMFIKN